MDKLFGSSCACKNPEYTNYETTSPHLRQRLRGVGLVELTRDDFSIFEYVSELKDLCFFNWST